MPSIAVLNMQGQEVGQQELSEAVFGIEPNVSVMNDMVKNYLANQRQGTQSALTRSEVSGGGKKPWRQKGTGRARQGSTRAPQWDPRRHRVRSQAPGVPLRLEQEGAPPGYEERPLFQGARQ